YPLSNEIADYGTISWSRDRIQTSVFSEFTWNQNFPGSAEYGLTPEKYADLWDPFGKDMSKNKELQSLVKRACDDVFGISNSKYFYNSQLLFTDNKFATNWQDMRYILEKSAMPDLDDKKCAEFMDRIYHNSDIIVKDMETVKKESSDQEIKMKANRLLYYHYYTRVIAHVQTLLLNASLASKKGEHEEADKLIKEAFNVYAEEGQKLKGNWLTIQGQSLEYPRFKIPPFDDSGMKELKNQMDMINVKVQSRKMMADRKNKSTADKKDEAKANKPVKAAVFRPDLKDGLTFGGKGLITLLNGINDIISEEIDNLSPETLKKYDCVIIPDCKSFGKVNANINNIRSYVIDQGGGMYFEHDSCGFNRFPLKGSVFPEIADAKERIGEPISSGERYKKTDRVLKIVKQHPVTAGYADGTSYEQVYFDHIQLGNETGMVLVEDTYGKPVIVAGQSGNGRVVFNGGITLNAVKDEELDKPLATVEVEIIVNSIYWLAKDKKGTELIMAGLKKNDMTLSNMQASVISFKPQIIPCKTLHDVVLTVQCFNAKDLRPISPKIKLSKIDEITEKWESDENVIINAESYPQVRVVMELSSREGRGVVAKIIGNKE
ncbi:MAG: hypothetical protein NT118_07945, partial [Lentisphaerae bacterium]|nr:hypothetical protein [Lentisphaerota bacterium]